MSDNYDPLDPRYAPGTDAAEYERTTREIAPIVMRMFPLIAVLVLVLWLLRGLDLVVWLVLAALLGWVLFRLGFVKRPWREILAAKLAEWRNDWGHLREFFRQALQPPSEQKALAMAQQQHFLRDRMMSPLRIFTILPFVAVAVAVGWGLWEMNSATRARADRDRACTAQEMRGDTTRQACADLAAAEARVARVVDAHNTAVQYGHQCNAQIVTERSACEADRERQRQEAARASRNTEKARLRRVDNEARDRAAGGARRDPVERLRELATAGPGASAGTGAGSDAPAGADPAVVPPATGTSAGPNAAPGIPD